MTITALLDIKEELDRRGAEIERLRAALEHSEAERCKMADVALADHERLQRHVDELQEKVKATDCGCSHDGPGDVCMVHSPTVNRLLAALEEAAQRLDARGHKFGAEQARAAAGVQQPAPQRCAECICDDPPSQCDWIKPR